MKLDYNRNRIINTSITEQTGFKKISQKKLKQQKLF